MGGLSGVLNASSASKTHGAEARELAEVEPSPEMERAFAAERARPMRVRVLCVVFVSLAIWASQAIMYETQIFPSRRAALVYRASELVLGLAIAFFALRTRALRRLEWGCAAGFSALVLAHACAVLSVFDSCVVPFTLTMEWAQLVIGLAALLSFAPTLMLLAITWAAGILVTAARAKWDFDFSDHIVLGLIYGVVLLSIRSFDKLRRSEFLARTNLDRANQSLREAERVRSWLFQNLSHDFRTPLALINAEAELLELKGRPADLAGLSRIRANATALAELTSELLELSRLEVGRVPRDARSFDLAELLREIAAQFTRETVAVRALLESAELGVLADPGQTRRIFGNLVANATRAARSEVTLVPRFEPGFVCVDVVDDGAGIAEDRRSAVFERFVSFDSAGGVSSGIGLPLARELCELNGGTLTLEDAARTTFRVRLPVAAAPLESVLGARRAVGLPKVDSAEPVAPVGKVARSVLIVEDNPDMRRLLEALLAPHFMTSSAAGVSEALERLERETPNAILCDVLLPDGDGYGVLSRVRAERRLDGVPLLFISALASVEHRTRGLAAGADDYVTKPFTTAELLARLSSACTRAEARRQALVEQRQDFLAELHDGVTASLARAALLLSSAEDGTAQPAAVAAALDAVREGLDEARTILSLVDAGTKPFAELVESLQEQVDSAAEFSLNARFEVDSDGSASLLSAVEAHALSRAVRESLSNVIKHARARELEIRLTLERGSVRLQVEDDGKGLAAPSKGRGLAILQRRVQRLAGSLTLGRSARGGLCLLVEFPLSLLQRTDGDDAQRSREATSLALQ
jgi:signal transduction histidine kinase